MIWLVVITYWLDKKVPTKNDLEVNSFFNTFHNQVSFSKKHLSTKTTRNILRMAEAEVIKIKRCNCGEYQFQHFDVYIGPECYKNGWNLDRSKWANPFDVKEDARGSVYRCLRMYKQYILKTPELCNSLHELDKKILGCWCRPGACHGDVLIELREDQLQYERSKAKTNLPNHNNA